MTITKKIISKAKIAKMVKPNLAAEKKNCSRKKIKALQSRGNKTLALNKSKAYKA